VQYDFGKQTPYGIEVTRTLNKPPALLLRVVDNVEDEYETATDEDSFFTTHLQRFAKIPRMKESYRHPSVPDRLFLANYLHEDGTQCILHDESYEIERSVRYPTEIRVH
jgi:hypothetical protein